MAQIHKKWWGKSNPWLDLAHGHYVIVEKAHFTSKGVNFCISVCAHNETY